MHVRAALLILALAHASPLCARQCLPETTHQRFARAHWVFVGNVLDRTPTAVRMQVLRTIKGPAHGEASILLDDSSPLAVSAVDGKPALVFAQRQAGAWTAGACSGTSAVQRQDERFLALGFDEGDFEALGLPTDASLMRRLASEWLAYREALLACPDARCHQQLQGDTSTSPAALAYFEREFPIERALHAALDATGSHRLIGGGVGDTTAYLRYALTRPYHPAHEAAYDGFEVEFRRIDDERWAIQGTRARVLANLPRVRERHRAWNDAPR